MYCQDNSVSWQPSGKTEAAMPLQLAWEDAQDEIAGLDEDALHTTSPKDMISQGIQLESSQYMFENILQFKGLITMIRRLCIHT